MILDPVMTMANFNASKGKPPDNYPAGTEIFHEGESGTIMYGIIRGDVNISVDGKTFETLHAGDVFGIGAIVHADHLRSSTAVAKTDCEIVTFDQEHFLFASQEMPVFALEVMKKYTDRLRFIRC